MKTVKVKTSINSFNSWMNYIKECLNPNKKRVRLINLKTNQSFFVTGSSLADYVDDLIAKGNTISEIKEDEREIYFK
jgi:hypothetical protein